MKKRMKKGQVWIETIIYTLIAFVMIGLVLSYARPKIEELQDNALLKQSTDMMKQIDTTILTLGGPGNKRILEIGIKKGTLNIDGINEKIFFEMESQSVYSEPGTNISDGAITVLTQKRSGYNVVTLTLMYDKYNIKFEGEDELRQISKSSTSYKLSISNEGKDANDKTILDISLG